MRSDATAPAVEYNWVLSVIEMPEGIPVVHVLGVVPPLGPLPISHHFGLPQIVQVNGPLSVRDLLVLNQLELMRRVFMQELIKVSLLVIVGSGVDHGAPLGKHALLG